MKSFVKWLFGERAGNIVLSGWDWLWGISAESPSDDIIENASHTAESSDNDIIENEGIKSDQVCGDLTDVHSCGHTF